MPLTTEQRAAALAKAVAAMQKAQQAVDYGRNQEQLTKACEYVAEQWQQSQAATKILTAAAAAAIAEIDHAGVELAAPAALMSIPVNYKDIVNEDVNTFNVNRNSLMTRIEQSQKSGQQLLKQGAKPKLTAIEEKSVFEVVRWRRDQCMATYPIDIFNLANDILLARGCCLLKNSKGWYNGLKVRYNKTVVDDKDKIIDVRPRTID